MATAVALSSTLAQANVATAHDAELHAFVEWMNSNGFQLNPGVGFVSKPGSGRCTIALRPLSRGCHLFRVPHANLLGPPNCTASVRSKTFREELLSFPDPDLALVVSLMSEKALHTVSPWKPFLDVVPDSYETP